MQFADSQGLVNLGPRTLTFTGVVADPATDSGERMLILKKLQRLVIPAVVDQGDKALDADMGRTGGLARRGSSFAYAESTGDSLWILFENCLSKIKFFVVFVGGRNGADLRTLAAAGAFCKVYITGFFMNFCSKVPRLAFDA